MLASAANCLPVWYLFESNDKEVTGCEISWYITSWHQHHKQSQVRLAVWGAVISISVDHLWSMMSTGSNLSPAGCRHLTLIFVCAGIQALVVQWYKCWTMCTICYPCAMYIHQSQNKIIFCQTVYLLLWNFFAYKKQDVVWILQLFETVKSKCNILFSVALCHLKICASKFLI